MEREQEKFSGEWAGTTRPSNQSLDYSAVRVCGGTHVRFACVFNPPLPPSSSSPPSPLLFPIQQRQPPFVLLSYPLRLLPLLLLLLLPFFFCAPSSCSPVSSYSPCPVAAASRLSPVRVLASLPPLLSPSCSSSFHATSVSATAFCSSTRSRGQIGFLRCSR